MRHDADEIAHMFGDDTPTRTGRRERILLRVFVHFYGTKVVLLLGGYDKGADPKEKRQQREIAHAQKLLTQFKERQRREKQSQR